MEIWIVKKMINQDFCILVNADNSVFIRCDWIEHEPHANVKATYLYGNGVARFDCDKVEIQFDKGLDDIKKNGKL